MRHEDNLQKAVILWFKLQYPKVDIIHIPNGNKLSIGVATKNKALGVLKGVSDLFIPDWFLWIELKTSKEETGRKGKPSIEQLAFIENRKKAGYHAEICYGFSEAEKTIKKYAKIYLEKNSKS